MTTRYAVLSFQKKGQILVAGQPRNARNSESAIAMAEKMAGNYDGVIAFAQEVDVETDCYDEPAILFRNGILPEELSD